MLTAIFAQHFIRFKWANQPDSEQCDLPRIMLLLTQLCSHLNVSFFRKIACRPELIYLIAFNLTKVIDASQNPCELWSNCKHLSPHHTRGEHQRARAQAVMIRLFRYSEEENPLDDPFDG